MSDETGENPTNLPHLTEDDIRRLATAQGRVVTWPRRVSRDQGNGQTVALSGQGFDLHDGNGHQPQARWFADGLAEFVAQPLRVGCREGSLRV